MALAIADVVAAVMCETCEALKADMQNLYVAIRRYVAPGSIQDILLRTVKVALEKAGVDVVALEAHWDKVQKR